MHLTGIDLFLWAAGLCAHVILLVILFARQHAKTFPFFTLLIGINVMRTGILFAILQLGNKHTYLVAYLTLALVDLTLQFCVVYEMAWHVFCPIGRWAPDTQTGLAWVVCVSVTVAFGLTWLSALSQSQTWLRTVLVRGNFFSAVLMTELFVGMAVLSATVRLPWKTHAARIAQGFGFYSLICVVIEAGHSYFGVDHNRTASANLSYFRMITYLICAGYWIVMLWMQAPDPKALPERVRLQLYTLQKRVESDLQWLRVWRP